MDLVAIGLIADLVQLSGDCRYLPQLGLKDCNRICNSRLVKRDGLGWTFIELCQKVAIAPRIFLSVSASHQCR